MSPPWCLLLELYAALNVPRSLSVILVHMACSMECDFCLWNVSLCVWQSDRQLSWSYGVTIIAGNPFMIAISILID